MGTTLVDVEEKVNQSSSPASGTSDGTAGEGARAERGNRLERGAALQVPTVAESQVSISWEGKQGRWGVIVRGLVCCVGLCGYLTV